MIIFEGVVKDGHIRLISDVRLPDNTKVFVVVSDLQVEQVAHVFTPRLVHSEQVADFVLEVVEEPSDAGI